MEKIGTPNSHPTTAGTATAPKKKRHIKKKWIIIPAVVLVLAALLVRILQSQRVNMAMNASSVYTETSVETRDITSSLSSSGTLQPANSYTVTTLVAGNILSAGFEEGDMVKEGTTLYQIDNSDVSNNIEKSQLSLNQAQRSYDSALDSANVKTTVAGTVYSLDVKVGDSVQQGQTVATLRDSDLMTLTTSFPSDDAQNFYVGQTATVTLDGSFETLTGTVTTISGTDIVNTGNSIVRNITISVKNPGGLSTTQSATVTISGVNCTASATFTYSAENTVTASASGTVKKLNVQEGNTVSANQTIVTLGGDAIDDQIQAAKDSLDNARLSMESTRDQLDNYTITSPISGTIIDKQGKAGDKVETGATLCTIYDLSYLEMTMNVDELDINQVSVGQTVQITADAVEGAAYQGIITKVSVAGNTTNGITTYPVTVRINETDRLRPGMNVDAKIVLAEESNALSIPNAALNRGNIVLITADSPSATNALSDMEAPEGYVYVTVETGLSDNDYIQIASGLQEGDTVAYIKASTSSDDFVMMMGGSETAVGSDNMGNTPPDANDTPSIGGGMPAGGGPQE